MSMKFTFCTILITFISNAESTNLNDIGCNGFAVNSSEYTTAYATDVCRMDGWIYSCDGSNLVIKNYTDNQCTTGEQTQWTLTTGFTENNSTYTYNCGGDNCTVLGNFTYYSDSSCSTQANQDYWPAIKDYCYYNSYYGGAYKITCNGDTTEVSIYSNNDCSGTAAASGDITSCTATSSFGIIVDIDYTICNPPPTNEPTELPTERYDETAELNGCKGVATESYWGRFAFSPDYCGNASMYHCHDTSTMEILNYTNDGCTTGEQVEFETTTNPTWNDYDQKITYDCSSGATDCHIIGSLKFYNDTTCQNYDGLGNLGRQPLMKDYCNGFLGVSWKLTCDGSTTKISVYTNDTTCNSNNLRASGSAADCVGVPASNGYDAFGISMDITSTVCDHAFNSKQLSYFAILFCFFIFIVIQ